MAPSSHELPPLDLVRVLRQPAELVTRLELALALERPGPLVVPRRAPGVATVGAPHDVAPTESTAKRATRERG